MSTRARRVMVLAAIISYAGSISQAARADDPSNPGSGSSCVVQGTALVPKDQAIYSAASGGNKIAQFSGALCPLKATNFPADATAGRVQINTGAGFRVEGFTDPKTIPVWAVHDLPVAADHLWISGGRSTRLLGASPGKLRVELPARGSLAQAVRATAGCEAFSFGKVPPPIFEVPGHARGYVAQSSDLDLFGSSSGDLAYTLHVSGEGSGVLLWSQETRGAYVHVTSRFELFVDAWVKKSDVKALPPGEMMDQTVPPESVQNPPQLGLSNYMKLVQAPRNVPLHFGRGDATPTIGEIETGTEVYVIDIILGWASVIPKTLHVMPNDDKGFWVKAADLGIATPAPDAGAPRK
jgi:hypothetical protein